MPSQIITEEYQFIIVCVMMILLPDRVGGRTKTVSLKSRDGTDQWDVGGQWVGK